MWKTVAKEEKRIRELAESARRRAQRRKAFYDSRLGDPTQLLRVSGTATHLVANSESYTFHEDPSSLMPWAGDSTILIDRFDGRALLDFLPTDPASVVESGLRPDRDEDGIGNELRYERWHDLADKIRLHIPEEQCLLDNEEEWNDLVARHHALIGKGSEKKRNNIERPTARQSFAFDYGTTAAQHDSAIGQAPEKELTALEEENIFDHLDDLTSRDRDSLDSLGKEFYIKDYYRVLRVAKEEEDERVNQLKVTAVNLERALAGKKPLKASEIEGLASSPAKNQGRGGQGSRRHRNRRRRSRSSSPRGGRRSSPSYEPYQFSSSRSGSESPSGEKVEFIQEFKIGSPKQDKDSEGEYDYYNMDLPVSSSSPVKSATSHSSVGAQVASTSRSSFPPTSSQAGQGGIDASKLSLVEKLKQRMRQGLEQSALKKQTKDQVHTTASLTRHPVQDLTASGSHQDRRRSHQRDEKECSSSTKRKRSRSRSRSRSPRRRNRSRSSSPTRRRESERARDHEHRPDKNTRRSSPSRKSRSRSRSPSRRHSHSYSRRGRRDHSRSRSRSPNRLHSRRRSRSRSRSRPRSRSHDNSSRGSRSDRNYRR